MTRNANNEWHALKRRIEVEYLESRTAENLGFVQEKLRCIVKLCEFNLRSMQSRKVAEERLGVDVCLTEEILESAPECPHGKKC